MTTRTNTATTERFAIKRIHEAPSAQDGHRVLVDRLWPRGFSRDKAGLSAWAKELTPGSALRKQVHGGAIGWDEFRFAYVAELDASIPAKAAADDLRARLADGPVTLLTATRDQTRNHAIVLREWLESGR